MVSRVVPDSIRTSLERMEHPFYMWDELLKTPESLKTILTPSVQTEVERAAEAIRNADVVHFVGCGTSYFSSIAGMYAFHRIAGIRAQAHNAFEFSAYPPPGLATSAVVAISHTGSTAVVLDAVKLAERSGAITVAVTEGEQSALADAASHVIGGGGGAEKPLPKTRSYISSLMKHCLLSVEVAERNGRGGSALKTFLETAPNETKRVIDENMALTEEIARSLSAQSKIYLFGGGPHVASALEGTLKLQESVQAQAFGFELEEGMHGPWVTMEPEDLVIVYAVQGPSFAKAIGLIRALQPIGARVWVLTDHDSAVPGATWQTGLPTVPEVISPLYATIPVYEFAYKLALVRKIRPDAMRLSDERYLDARLKLPR
jgi:glucosamine--fructose-6-phosphate aminotransferase (isomerizing)